jgi:hypothetical protein
VACLATVVQRHAHIWHQATVDEGLVIKCKNAVSITSNACHTDETTWSGTLCLRMLDECNPVMVMTS